MRGCLTTISLFLYSRCGVYIYSGGKATLENCMCKGAKEFDGLAVFGKGPVSQVGSKIVAQGCSFVENNRNGITVGQYLMGLSTCACLLMHIAIKDC